MDRLTSLTVFGAAVETGGVLAAARRLNMSETMVNDHIRSLEERLGMPLFDRTSARKMRLTEIGKAYYERSRQILIDLDEADQIADAVHSTPRGTLRVHANTNIVRLWAPVIEEYLTLYPGVSIDLTTGEQMVDLVVEGYDVAIRTVSPPDSDLMVRRLSPWRHILCCKSAYLETHPEPKHPSDLANHNCLQYAFYPHGDEWHFEGPEKGKVTVHITGNVVSTNGNLLRSLTLKGHGILLAPSFLVADELTNGSLVTLLSSYRPIEFSINAIYPHRNHLSSKVRIFIELLADHFADKHKG